MRILWLCNIMLPAVAESLGLQANNKEGWLSGLADRIVKEKSREIELGVCFPVERGQEGLEGRTQDISYYGFFEDTVNLHRYSADTEQRLKEILHKFNPDVVHIFGTEFPHCLAMTRAFGRPERTLIGIQGVCFVYADYFMQGLPENVRRRSLFRDFVKRDNIVRQQRKFVLRGEMEKEALKGAGHVTGRTAWDREVCREAAPKAKYHVMNETLRSNFYGPEWKEKECVPHSVFLSQGNYPIKGLHFALRALPKIRGRYPDACLYVAGDKITAYESLKDKLKIGSYGKYILDLVRKLKLERSVVFLGRQNAEQMCARYLKSHVFLSPSTIENSPNSVGEAMLLGVPVVSSRAGGVESILEPEKEGLLYETEDTDALASCVLRIFGSSEEAARLSQAEKIRARRTHDPDNNLKRLMEIYHEINLCV